MPSAAMDSLLIRHFRQFYAEAARRRAMVTHAPPAAALGASVGGGGSTSDPVLHTWQALLGLLQAQADEAVQQRGVLGARLYQELQYVEAALADEMFLQGEWEGRARWPLLEASLFHTQSAGETIFERIEVLLQRADQAYADLATVYFWALALGFEGKYRGGDTSALQQYRQRLFRLLYRDRSRLFDRERALFPQAYLHNLEEGSGRRLPNPRVWIGVIVLVLVVWWGVAQLGWQHLTTPLDQAICQMNPHAAGCEDPAP
ncbi:MAG: DotU family type IV/VI secretion system protein [Chloroflexota bacterium]